MRLVITHAYGVRQLLDYCSQRRLRVRLSARYLKKQT